jgi:endonuclease G
MLRSKLPSLATLTGAFSVGLGLGIFFKNSPNDESSFISNNFKLNRPHYAATVQNPPPSAIIPEQSIMPVKSVDDLSIRNMNRTREIMQHGYPSLDNLRVFDNYVLSYDRRNRVANWVYEHITSTHIKPAQDVDRGKSEFKEDAFIHQYFRSTNHDYYKSGYDRGHLAAAANHRSSQHHMDQTFFLSNIAPQVGQGFNRDKWNDLEKEARNLVKKNDNVWVCTGPLYLPRREADNKLYVKYEVIGPHNVSVPTHFFKVILCEKQGVYTLYSYVLPNAPCDNSTPLTNYLVPIDSIERAAGFLIFDKVPRNQIKYLNPK